jgi:hypothetical protein
MPFDPTKPMQLRNGKSVTITENNSLAQSVAHMWAMNRN